MIDTLFALGFCMFGCGFLLFVCNTVNRDSRDLRMERRMEAREFGFDPAGRKHDIDTLNGTPYKRK